MKSQTNDSAEGFLFETMDYAATLPKQVGGRKTEEGEKREELANIKQHTHHPFTTQPFIDATWMTAAFFLQEKKWYIKFSYSYFFEHFNHLITTKAIKPIKTNVHWPINDVISSIYEAGVVSL